MRTKLVTLFLALALLAGFARWGGAGDAKGPGCDIASRQADLGDGVMPYHAAGEGPAVLLLHGLFARKEQWSEVLCRLSEAGFAAVAPDLPGYGESDGFSLEDYRLDLQVERLHDFVEKLGMDGFHLAGNSMGGTIAALYAGKYPERVRSLAFIGGPFAAGEWAEGVKEAIYRGVNPFIPVDSEQFDLEMDLLFAGPPRIPQAFKKAAVEKYVERNLHYRQVWDIVSLYDTALYGRQELSMPVLVLWGEDDEIFDSSGAAPLRDRIPGSSMVLLPRTGHLPMVENPAGTAEAYLELLKGR